MASATNITYSDNAALTVVIVSNTATSSGGASRVAIDSATALSDAGIQVVFFGGAGPVCKELNASGIKVVCLDNRPYLESGGVKGAVDGLWDKQTSQTFRKLLTTLDPASTIIHFHSWQHAVSASPFKAATDLGFRVVITAHEYSLVCPNMALFNYQEKHACELEPMSFACFKCHCDKRTYVHKLYRFLRETILLNTLRKTHPDVIFISDMSRSIINNKMKDNFIRSFSYLPDPVNVSKHTVTRYDDREDYFVYAGRLSPEKDPETFCQACRISGIRGIIVGDGELREKLETEYSDIVDFVGWKTRDEVAEYISHSRGLVFPSLCFETAGLSVLEAQISSNTPCIVSETSVTREYISDGRGLSFKAGDATDLASKLEELSRPEVFASVQSAIAGYDYSNFDMDTHISKLLDIYIALVCSQETAE